MLLIVDREPDGRQRVARAVQAEYNSRFWNLTVEHPSGSVTKGTYSGTKYEAGVALADLMNRSANDFAQERSRGDRPAPKPYDGNRSVDLENPPIVPVISKGW
jgi:hypothetical protein